MKKIASALRDEIAGAPIASAAGVVTLFIGCVSIAAQAWRMRSDLLVWLAEVVYPLLLVVIGVYVVSRVIKGMYDFRHIATLQLHSVLLIFWFSTQFQIWSLESQKGIIGIQSRLIATLESQAMNQLDWIKLVLEADSRDARQQLIDEITAAAASPKAEKQSVPSPGESVARFISRRIWIVSIVFVTLFQMASFYAVWRLSIHKLDRESTTL